MKKKKEKKKPGWPNHPHGQGGGPATPKRPQIIIIIIKGKIIIIIIIIKGFSLWLRGGPATPWPKGRSGHPQKATKKKKKNGFWLMGVAEPTP
jgi:hypothetical protein